VANAVAECHRLEIPVLKPDIQTSRGIFTIEKNDEGVDAICFGLATIKNVGQGAVESFVTERDEGGKFKSIEDFCRRCDLSGTNKRAMESMIKAGVFDELEERGTLVNNLNSILSLAQREQRLKDTGQTTMFDLFGEKTALPMPSLEMETYIVSDRDKAAWEKELMGVAFSRKLLDPSKINPEVTLCGTIDNEMNGQNVTVAGEVASVAFLFTRKDSKQFAKVIVEDISGGVEVTVWPRIFDETRELWEEGNIIQIEGTVRLRDEDVQLSVNKASLYELSSESVVEEVVVPIEEVPTVEEIAVPVEETVPESVPNAVRRLVISMSQTNDKEGDVHRLHKLNDVIREFSGEDEVILRLENGTKVDVLSLDKTGYCDELYERLVRLVGEEGVKVDRGLRTS